MTARSHQGHFVRGETLLECRRIPGDDAGAEWSTDTMLLTEDNFSYALGSKVGRIQKATSPLPRARFPMRLVFRCRHLQIKTISSKLPSVLCTLHFCSRVAS